ncbi:MAG TPA: ADOP family duplicated permease [Gemmatimonadaceae bacterium]|nr:ADOP family duplicated permease [Gemmatimonadaceae bacterium]
MLSPWLPRGIRRLFQLPATRARMARELDEELRTHFAMRVEELRARGLSRDDAEAEARRRFGDLEEFQQYAAHRIARRARWLRVTDWLAELVQDVRFAARQFTKARSLTAIALLTLALGIGANAAIFTVVHRLLIAPLPYPDGDRIVKLVVGDGNAPDQAMLAAWRDRARSVDAIGAVSVHALFLQDFGDTRDTVPAFITASYLRLLGLRPALGRDFTPADAQPGAPAVTIISYRKWQREFGGRADVLGSTIPVPDLDDRQYAIIGVAPREMSIPMSAPAGVSGKLRQATPAIWLPASLDSLAGSDVFARLRPGVAAAAATRELQSILDSEPPTGREPVRARAMRAQDFLDPREAQTVQVLFVAVGVLLLIACATVANLLMSRAWTRRREFAVRTALGAGRLRLARQVLTESVLLALAGGLLGMGVAWAALEIILTLRPPSLEHLDGVTLHPAVLFWTAGISVGTGILFGSAPALFAGARPVGDVLRSETRTASGGSAAQRMRSALIVFEIAMSLVLLVGAGLLVRSFVGLQRMHLGFRPQGLVATDVMLSFGREGSAADRAARRDELFQLLRAMPGVTGAAMGMMPGQGWRVLATLESEPDASGHSRSVADFAAIFITPDYFRLAGMSLVAGRPPDSLTWPRGGGNADPSMSPEVVVSQALARRLWPEGGAIGARLVEKSSGPFTRAGRSASYTVVGIVEDVRLPGGRDARWTMELYSPMPPRLFQLPLVLRTTMPEREIVSSIRRVVADFDRTLRGETGLLFGAILREVTVGDTYVRESLAPARFAMALLVAFSVVALVLSGVGLYGVIAYSVAQRTREIGVRLALGADAMSVKRLVVGGGLRLAMVGIGIGVVAAAGSTRVLSHVLYGVSPADPGTFVAIAVLVVTIAVAAAYIPAHRATRIAPTEALRAE